MSPIAPPIPPSVIDQLVPRLLQWHNDYGPEMELRWGEHFGDLVRNEAARVGKTPGDVRGWKRPEKKRTARKGTIGAMKQPDEVG